MIHSRRILIWISFVFEFSLIMGIGLYYLRHQDSSSNNGGLIQFVEAQSSPFLQEEVTVEKKERNQSLPAKDSSYGGPYVVAPAFRVSTYRVRNGENLWTIAKKNNLDFYTLLTVNNLKKANEVSVGQKLKISNQRGILHKVSAGETLEDVALKYEADIRKIIRVNRILNPAEISKGAELFVPGAKITLAFSKELLEKSGISIPDKFIWPCRRGTRISSGFGYRKDPFTGARAFHSGTDFAPGYGSSVYASMDGVVTYAGWMGGYGKLVVIQHKVGYSTRYGHLSSIFVSKGKRVRQGHRIGLVGNTGRSKGPHLHFEIRKVGTATNAVKLLKR